MGLTPRTVKAQSAPPSLPAPIVSLGSNPTEWVGGSKYSDNQSFWTPYCDEGEMISGIAGYADSVVRRIGIFCVKVGLDGWVVPTGKSPSTAPRWRGAVGEKKGAYFEQRCPVDHVMTGFRGRAGWSLDQLQIVCRRLADDLDGLGVNLSTKLYKNKAGGSGGSKFAEVACSGSTAGARIDMKTRDGVASSRPIRLRLVCKASEVAVPKLLYYDVYLRLDRQEVCFDAKVTTPGWSTGTLPVLYSSLQIFMPNGLYDAEWAIPPSGYQAVNPDGTRTSVIYRCFPIPTTRVRWRPSEGTWGGILTIASLTDSWDRYYESTVRHPVTCSPGLPQRRGGRSREVRLIRSDELFDLRRSTIADALEEDARVRSHGRKDHGRSHQVSPPRQTACTQQPRKSHFNFRFMAASGGSFSAVEFVRGGYANRASASLSAIMASIHRADPRADPPAAYPP